MSNQDRRFLEAVELRLKDAIEQTSLGHPATADSIVREVVREIREYNETFR